MSNFLSALSRAGPSAFQGYNDEMAQLEKQRQIREQGAGADAYGAILRQIAAQQSGQPQAMPSTGSFQPMQPGGQPPSNVIPFQPGGIPQMKPMGGPPTASPMPGGPPPQMPPGGMPQGGGQPQMGQPPAPPMQPPMQGGPDSMSRPMTGGGNQPNQGGGNPLQNLTLQQIVQGIKQSNPGISDAALGIAMDKFLPLMNAQAQLQYRMGMLGQGQQRIDQGQQRINETGRHNQVGEDDRARRLAQFDTQNALRAERIKQLEPAALGHLPPQIKAQADALRVRYQQEASNYREAMRTASFHQGDPEYEQQVMETKVLMFDSQRDYLDFLEKSAAQPQATSPAGAPGQGPTPSTAPAKPATTAPAKPSGPPPPPGFTEQGGKGGPLLGETSGIVGPVRARPASADVWDDPTHPHGVGKDSPISVQERNPNTPDPGQAQPYVAGRRADAPAMFAPRGEGDAATPVPEEMSVPGLAREGKGNFERMQQALAQVKAAHKTLTDTMGVYGQHTADKKPTSAAKDAKTRSQFNKDSVDAESNISGWDIFQQRIDQLEKAIKDAMTPKKGLFAPPRKGPRVPPSNDLANR